MNQKTMMIGVIVLAAITAILILLLWPKGERTNYIKGPYGENTLSGKVLEVDTYQAYCAIESSCQRVLVSIDSLDNPVWLQMPSWQPDKLPRVGDTLRVVDLGTDQAGPSDVNLNYRVIDKERGVSMIALIALFSLAVILLARKKGILSLSSIALSLAVVVFFLLPAILSGSSLLLVSLASASAVMLMTIFLTHGFGAKSLAAAWGTGASLILVAILAILFVGVSNLVGVSVEGSETFTTYNNFSLTGLIVAGIIIASLGVLDDVTISQASAVFAVRKANPSLSFWQVYRLAIEVGRDHVSAAVNTLIFAYVGASLPVLIILSSGSADFWTLFQSDAIAREVIAMLVGSIGIIFAVPATTLFALLADFSKKDKDTSLFQT